MCVQVLCGRGNNLHQVEEADGQQFLASMPTKFRKNVWIKRGVCVCVCVCARVHLIVAPGFLDFLSGVSDYDKLIAYEGSAEV